MNKSKFRAWDTAEAEWVDYPVYIDSEGNVFWEHYERGLQEADDLIVMQSTGLKDLKGVEIFEGDVVWIIDEGEMDNGWGWFEEVKFRNGSFMAGDDFLINSHHRCVAHGNIHANPELLSSGIE